MGFKEYVHAPTREAYLLDLLLSNIDVIDKVEVVDGFSDDDADHHGTSSSSDGDDDDDDDDHERRRR